MKLKIIVLTGVLLLLGIGMPYQHNGSQVVAADAPYLFDLIKRPVYNKAWLAMFRNEKDAPQWLVNVEGPATPVERVNSKGIAYQLSSVCKPHDCGDNIFHVIFSSDGRKAWGLLLVNENNERFFGSPDADLKALLRTASRD